MGATFVRCREEDGYQSRLPLLIAEESWCRVVPTVVLPAFLAFPENFGHLYDVSSRFYLVREILSKSYVRERQKIFWGLRCVQRFRLRSLDRVRYYGGLPPWWTQYKLLTLLSVPSSFIPAYNGEVPMRGPAADHSGTLTITLNEYVFVESAMFIVGAMDWDRPTYFTESLRLDHLSEKPLLRLPTSSLDTLARFVVYRLAVRTGTVPLMAALAFRKYMKVAWDKKYTEECFVRYKFTSWQVPGLHEESVQIANRAKNGAESSITVTPGAVQVCFGAGRRRVHISDIFATTKSIAVVLWIWSWPLLFTWTPYSIITCCTLIQGISLIVIKGDPVCCKDADEGGRLCRADLQEGLSKRSSIVCRGG